MCRLDPGWWPLHDKIGEPWHRVGAAPAIFGHACGKLGGGGVESEWAARENHLGTNEFEGLTREGLLMVVLSGEGETLVVALSGGQGGRLTDRGGA
jgi:hypothetical protein